MDRSNRTSDDEARKQRALDLQDQLSARLDDEGKKLLVQLVIQELDLGADSAWASADLHIPALAAHFPGLAPALIVVWRHVTAPSEEWCAVCSGGAS
jgi:hypothetical protein